VILYRKTDGFWGGKPSEAARRTREGLGGPRPGESSREIHGVCSKRNRDGETQLIDWAGLVRKERGKSNSEEKSLAGRRSLVPEEKQQHNGREVYMKKWLLPQRNLKVGTRRSRANRAAKGAATVVNKIEP